jgi:vacuolar-type H+-ATPase subunit H
MVDNLEHCRKRAEEVVEEARVRARAIVKRTEQRIHLLHQRCEDAAGARIRDIASSFDDAGKKESGGSGDDKILPTAVEQLAIMLTTAERDGSEQ